MPLVTAAIGCAINNLIAPKSSDFGKPMRHCECKNNEYVLVKIDRYKSLQSDKSAYLRLVYLEVINNLEVLQTIDLGRLKNSKPNEPAI